MSVDLHISAEFSPHASSDALDQFRMIGIAEVRRMMAGMSVRQIDRLIDAGRFPSPTFISPNRRAWRFRAIVEFLDDLENNGTTKRVARTRKRGDSPGQVADPGVGANAPHFTDDEIPY